MVDNLIKYSDEIITVVEAENFDNTKMEDVLISLDNLYQYIDFARELPEPIDGSTTTINEFLNDDLIKYVANINENLSAEYKANNMIDDEKLDTVINKLRIITNMVKSEGDVASDTKGIEENIVKTITQIKVELNK